MNFPIVRYATQVALAVAICGLLACGSVMQAGPERAAAVAPPVPAGTVARAAARAPSGAASTWLELNHPDCREALKVAFPSCLPKQAVVAELLLKRDPVFYIEVAGGGPGTAKPCTASKDCKTPDTDVIVKVNVKEETCTAQFAYPSLKVSGSAKDKVVIWTLKSDPATTIPGTYAYAASGVEFAQRRDPAGKLSYMAPATMWSPSAPAASQAEGKMKFKPSAPPHAEYYSACHYPIVDWTPPKANPIRCCPIDPIIINEP
jgi:hypothetical protein